jgi:hypothetical protein
MSGLVLIEFERTVKTDERRGMVTGGETPLERVGRAVEKRRTELGFGTQRELAERAGVGLNTAALLERGKSFPRPSNRIKFEQALRWPPGTLTALRRGEPVPTGEPGPPMGNAPANMQALQIAKGVAALATVCRQILLGQNNNPQAQAALDELDNHVLQLESVIAASLPHVAGSSFNETVAALAELHAIRNAASTESTTE